jgi:hypothetical protein
VAEIDINPLLALPVEQGARVVDCLIVPSTATRAATDNAQMLLHAD